MTPPIVQRLRDAAAAIRDERVSMRAMAQTYSPEAHGTLLLLLAMWRGQCAPCLPRGVAELELPRHWAQRVLVGLASAYALAGRHAGARLSHPTISPSHHLTISPSHHLTISPSHHLTISGRRSTTALVIGLMAAIVVMPIPFGNLLPAVALVFIGLGLVFRDGVAVILGLLMSGVTLVATTGLLVMAWVWGSEWILGWVCGTGPMPLAWPGQVRAP